MSAATGFSTRTVHVRLTNEVVDVWRPAQAIRLGENAFVIVAQSVPEDEAWEFSPGSVVVTETRDGTSGPYLVATAAATLVAA